MNKKIVFFLSTLIIITSFFHSVYAQDIEIVVPEKSVTVYAGKMNELEILVKNNGDTKDTLYFSIWPTYWVSLEKYWTSLGGGETTSILMTIEPPRDAEEKTNTFTITAISVDFDISVSKDIYLDIRRTTDVYLSEIKINKQSFKIDETVFIEPVLTSLEKRESTDVFMTTKIMKDDLIIKKFEDVPSIGPESTETLSHSFDIKGTHDPGDYSITVTLRDNLNKVLDEKIIAFKIETVHEIDKKKETKNSLLYNTVAIRVTNNGNVRESSFYVSESLPLISKNFFYPEIEPVSEEEKDNRIVYTWLVHDLDPGETRTIKYQLRFVNVVLISCILIIAIIWIVWLFFRPKLMKNYIGSLAKEREVTVSLYLKNKWRKPLNNIEVKDFVPAVVTVIKKFDTLTPKIKRKAAGTELIWNIKQLKPREERILTYKIRPVIDIIGELKLPKAYLTYETKKGKERRSLSKTITVMGKVK